MAQNKTKRQAVETISTHKGIENFTLGTYFTTKPKGKLIHNINLTCNNCSWEGSVNCFEPTITVKCPICEKTKRAKIKANRRLEYEQEYKINIAEGIEQGKLKYDNFYDYTKFKPKKPHNHSIITCPIHGEFKQNLHNHLNYFGCRKCLLEKLGVGHKKTLEEMLLVMKYIHKDTLDFTNFIATKAATNSEVKCNVCGHVFPTDFNHLTSTTLTGCNKCNSKRAGEKQRLSPEKALRNLNTKFRGVLGFSHFAYTTAKSYSDVYCPDCDKYFPGCYDTLMAPHTEKGCPYCQGFQRTQEEALQNLRTLADSKLDFSEFVYDGADGKSWVTCIKCGNRWKASYTLLVRGRSCGDCKVYAGEEAIKVYCETNKVHYMKQKSYGDCRNVLPLPFDFYLPECDLLVEYHGIQHYKFTVFFHRTLKGFEEQKRKDKIKKAYAEKQHNFLEIPYWDFGNIESILKEKLAELEINHLTQSPWCDRVNQ